MESLHQQLLAPSAYPDTTASVDFRETHISRVYLTDNFAYKLKKPLDLGFLDFSTLEKRHHFCAEEVRLNKRFAPDVYRGVLALRQRNGTISFRHDTGSVIDYAVQMLRLPQELMLDHMIDADRPGLPEAMQRLGKAVYTVQESSTICRHEPTSNAETVRANCVENFAQTRSAIGKTLSAEAHRVMQEATMDDLQELQPLMQQREVDGFCRDGHGDLHTANICMTDPICIYDCIEFNRRFRVADIVADLAFLIMDLEFRNRRDLAEKLLVHYLELSNDDNCRRLLPFYKGYRAWVRGKVEDILASEADAAEEARELGGALATRYFNLALGYRLKPTMFLFSGLMGVGKTTLARALARACGAVHLRSDVVRKELAGIPVDRACREVFGRGLYRRDMTALTYDELLRRALLNLQQAASVVIDASFAESSHRDHFLEQAARAGGTAVLLHLVCPEDVALSRLAQRSDDASDGRGELYSRQKALFECPGATNQHITIDTTYPVDYNVQSLLCNVLNGPEQLL